MVRVEVGAMLYVWGLPHELAEQAKRAASTLGGEWSCKDDALVLPYDFLQTLEDGLEETRVDYRVFDKTPYRNHHQYQSIDYVCVGCNDPVNEEVTVKLWVDTPLGTTVLRCHEGCEELAVASCREQPAIISRNQRQALNMMRGNK